MSQEEAGARLFIQRAQTTRLIHFRKICSEVAVSGNRVPFPRRRRSQITGKDTYAVAQHVVVQNWRCLVENQEIDVVAVQAGHARNIKESASHLEARRQRELWKMRIPTNPATRSTTAFESFCSDLRQIRTRKIWEENTVGDDPDEGCRYCYAAWRSE